MKLDAREISAPKNTIIANINGAAPTVNHNRAYQYRDELGRGVLFLDATSPIWANRFHTENGKYIFTTEFADEDDRKYFESFINGNKVPLRYLIFMKNIRGDKNHRFIGEFNLDTTCSVKENRWHYYRLDTVADAAKIISYKINGKMKDFSPLV